VLKVGDFSQLGQVSVRTLQYYDERGLLKPAEIDDWTGYRFYSVEQLPRLNRILALKDLGFSLDQISRLVDDDVPAEQLRGMLAMKQAEIERQLSESHARLARVEARLRQIEREGEPSPYEVVLKKVAPLKVVSSRAIVPTMADVARYREDLYERVYGWLAKNRTEPSGPELALYHNREYTEENMDMEAALPVDRLSASPDVADGVGVRQLPAVSAMASATFEGNDIWDIPGAVAALFVWVGENGYTSAGPMREVHHFGRELDHEDYETLVIEVQIPVE
jgi:DNA-binding transcriptional MerR regulator